MIKGCWYGPIEIYSKLGWILCGKYKNVSIYQSVINWASSHVLWVSAEHTESDALKYNLNRVFEIENLVVRENELEDPNSFIENFENNLF